MTAEQSLFLAKKKWDENVYCGMKMENRAVTFPQMRTILDGVNVPGAQLAEILNADTSATEKALNAFAWGTRSRLFRDGNKRTSLTLANKILLRAGAGMLTVQEKNMEQFNEKLLTFYNTGDADPLKVFLYDHAIQGIAI